MIIYKHLLNQVFGVMLGYLFIAIKLFITRNLEIKTISHYGRRKRSRQFPPLQEMKNSASQPFTLKTKVRRPPLSKMPT